MRPAVQSMPEPAPAAAAAAFPETDDVPCFAPGQSLEKARLPRWKYDAVRRAVMRVTIGAGGRGATLAELIAEAPRHLTPAELGALGSLVWHVTAVKLDLEARGELMRVSGASPLRHVRAVRDFS
jgi:hypothetical protein